MMKDIKARYYMVERSMQPKAIIFNGKLPIYLVDPMMIAQNRRKDQNNDNLANGSVRIPNYISKRHTLAIATI